MGEVAEGAWQSVVTTYSYVTYIIPRSGKDITDNSDSIAVYTSDVFNDRLRTDNPAVVFLKIKEILFVFA